jgi:glycine betaine/proline transport system ATP-binding protein
VVVQTGTPEDLVLRPADDYVAEFTRNVARAKVLAASSIMQPLPGDAPLGGWPASVEAGAKVADIASLVSRQPGPIAVIGATGEAVGLLHRQDVIDVMMGG